MKSIWIGILTLAAAHCACAADRFDIAITVDDLPVHGTLAQGMTRLGIAEAHIATFKAHHVPEAFGFVNARGIEREPGSEAVLDAWRKAGYPLGNHTYSHLNLDKAPTLEAWEADVIAGEPAVSTRMQGADWRYLRFPNLSGGSDKSRHDGARAFLEARGYRIADVSVSFDDFAYTDAYRRCVEKGDTQTIAAMKAQYLKGVDDNIARMKAVSQRVYGRVIPQVLLTHIGGWSAIMLPEVMAKLDAAGAHYVTLAQAQSDPAYAETDGGTVMSRAAAKKGINISDIPAAQPKNNINLLCR
ncbi:polysaccharide deacetylase family protein [Massilia horti]|uniref:Polysaccharide deacetylase n=1 Tax=Massilia horti TaxID=2562153 RepID=A0A4Y9T4K9_9BURK|nr:polysaccharide deacetylase family protein [Massilia horti]TFW34640.1 polysaccharide deacetylase [Massilia horti]